MALDHAKVDILLATYNGARFVERQIESVLEHVRPGWQILVRDDCSSDGTPAILNRFAASRPEHITVVEGGGERLGPSGNFARLMKYSDADYVMFCDQDDVWPASRIVKPLERMVAVEGALGRDTPVLVHTDLVVVDEDLRPIAPSFWRYHGLSPRIGNSLSRLLVQNVVTGCATTINRALMRLAYPIPATAIMHDWWLALVAAGCGRLEYIPEATVWYRQHPGNAIGARPLRWSHAARRLARRLLRLPMPEFGGLRSVCAQARTLLDRMNHRLPAERQATIQALLEVERCGFFKRRREVLRYGFLKWDWVSNVDWLTQL